MNYEATTTEKECRVQAVGVLALCLGKLNVGEASKIGEIHSIEKLIEPVAGGGDQAPNCLKEAKQVWDIQEPMFLKKKEKLPLKICL